MTVRREGRRRWRTAMTIAWMAACAVACQNGGVQVRGLEFEGNHAFPDGRLRDVVVTRVSGWLPWSRRHFFDQAVFEADLERLRAFYADRGYPDARVTAAAVELNDDNTTVRLRIGIDERAPLRVERVAFEGLDALDAALASEVRDQGIATGVPRDRQGLATGREQIAALLRDRGYPTPRVAVREDPGSTADQVVVTFAVEPGTAATFGEISVAGLSKVSEQVVRRSLTFAPGELFRQSKVIESQRELASLGLFSFAHIAPPASPDTALPGAPPPAAPASGAPAVPMRVTVTEAKATQLQVGIGYGSEEGPRGSLEWRHLNFLRDARRLTANLRYSARLRGGEVEFTEPFFLTRQLSLGGKVSGWLQDELTYQARSFGGQLSLSYHWHSSRGLTERPVDHRVRVAYVNETQRYEIDPETLADLTQFEEILALGFDPLTGVGRGRVAAIDVDAERIEVDQLLDPQHGYVLRANLRHARPALGGTFSFTELEAEARGYVPVGRAVLAGRMRSGSLRASAPDGLPFSARYFLGGSSSLRGWGRLQVSPLTVDGLPIGGVSLFELSSEVRVPVRGNIGLVLFVDAGNVWDDAEGIRIDDLRVDVGPGVRYASPFGIVRADFGVQLTPIDGLLVGGARERRQWRVHFSIGHAF
jgi:outer membrane protein insertion porin family